MPSNEFIPIRLLGIVTEDVGKPRNDGTSGSALYSVPIRLSEAPPAEWTHAFVEAWNNPSSYTSMHRRGICSIRGDRVILNGTTIEEIERTHAATLKLALAVANREYPKMLAKARAEETAREERARQHHQHVEEVAKRIKFD